MSPSPRDFGASCLHGVSQVVFMDDSITGILIILALAIASWQVTVLGLLSLFVSTLAGTIRLRLRADSSNHLTPTITFDTDSVAHGLMGYNGMLAGLTIATFPGDIADTSRLAMLAAMFGFVTIAGSKILGFMMQGPCFTVPFNICAAAYMGGPAAAALVAGGFATIHAVALGFRRSTGVGKLLVIFGIAALGANQYSFDYQNVPGHVDGFPIACLHGISQIFLAEHWLSGLLILAAIAYSSPRNASLATLGSVIGTAQAVLQNAGSAQIHRGLHGYGPALAAMAVGGGIFGKPTGGAFAWAILAALLAGLVQTAITQAYEPPAFTLGANVAIMLVLGAGCAPPEAAAQDGKAE